MPKPFTIFGGIPLALSVGSLLFPLPTSTLAAENGDAAKLPFSRENLVAWCIVPFDAKKRGPVERVAMLKELGFRRYAYDWRAEHLATFDQELELLVKNRIELTAVWFPDQLNADAQALLAAIKKHGLKTQLWVTTGDPAPGKTQAEKVAAAARMIRPLAAEAARLGCRVALYNHGNWFGEPENQLAVIESLKLDNVGIVYNLHHGHDHLDRFPALLKQMLPHLYALNINGMVAGGDRDGRKILPLGQGDLDLALLRTIRDSGYRGPIGILGHTQDDARERLADNLDGLDWLLPQLDGKSAGARPKYRTPSGAAPVSTTVAKGYLAEGKDHFRKPPITVEARVKVSGKEGYNILVACDTKASGSHWEIFSEAGNGMLTVYTPGLTPDHLRTKGFLCDNQWHHVALQLEPERVRLYFDGKLAAEQAVKSQDKAIVPGRLAFGRLVEGDFGCNGAIDYVHISRGLRPIAESSAGPPQADETTLGLWLFGKVGEGKEVEDQSAHKNTAR